VPDVAALVASTDEQANVLIAVATGGPRIAHANPEYI